MTDNLEAAKQFYNERLEAMRVVTPATGASFVTWDQLTDDQREQWVRAYENGAGNIGNGPL